MLVPQDDPRRFPVAGVELHRHVALEALRDRERQQVLEHVSAAARRLFAVARRVASRAPLFVPRGARDRRVVHRLDDADARKEV